MDFDNTINTLDKEEVLKFRFTQREHIIWPFVRYIIVNTKWYQYNKPQNNNLNTKYIFSLSGYLINSIAGNPFNAGNNDIIFFTTGPGISSKKDNKFFDKRYDYYALNSKAKSLIIEDSFNRVFMKPRYFNKVKYNDYIRLRTLFFSKIMSKMTSEDYDIINKFLNYIDNILPLDDNFKVLLKGLLLSMSKRIPYQEIEYKRLFRKTKPKLIIIHCGYYGDKALIIKTAKEMGITVAEFQHGLVSRNHEAYNYGTDILNSEKYKDYVPDYFLTYGKYWNDQIRIPQTAYAIGNPHFHQQLKNYKDKLPDKKTILIVSQWLVAKELVEIAEYLSEVFPNYKIIYKLHSGELNSYYLFEPLEKCHNVTIKKDGDIFYFISKSEIIIACYSTTVFEAFGMRKNIFILDNHYSRKHIPDNIGVRFNNNEELKKLISNKNSVENGDKVINYYFDGNWEENFNGFLKEEVGI